MAINRKTVTNPTAGALLEVQLSGHTLIIEDAPADAAADRTTVFFDVEEGGGMPLISRSRFKGPSFQKILLRGAASSTASSVTLLVIPDACVELELPPA